MSEQPPALDPATCRTLLARLRDLPDAHVEIALNGIDWVLGWLREQADLAAQAEQQAATPPDVRERAADALSQHRHPGEFLTVFGEAWLSCSCGHRIDLPVEDNSVSVSGSAALFESHQIDTLAAAGVLASTPRPEGETRRADLDAYLRGMDSAGGGVYTSDFRDGFRHALAMIDAASEPQIEGHVSPEASTPRPEGETRVEWGVRYRLKGHGWDVQECADEATARAIVGDTTGMSIASGGTLMTRKVPVTEPEWAPVEQDDGPQRVWQQSPGECLNCFEGEAVCGPCPAAPDDDEQDGDDRG